MSPVLEIIRLTTPNKTPAPNNPSILSALSAVRQNLKEAIHNTDSRFYLQKDRPELIYVFGEWDSVAQHVEFTSSAGREEILKPQEGVLDFVDVVHVKLPPGGIKELLDGKERFRLAWGISSGEKTERKSGSMVEMRRCDEGFEEESCLFDFSGDEAVHGDARYGLSGSIEIVDMELP